MEIQWLYKDSLSAREVMHLYVELIGEMEKQLLAISSLISYNSMIKILMKMKGL